MSGLGLLGGYGSASDSSSSDDESERKRETVAAPPKDIALSNPFKTSSSLSSRPSLPRPSFMQESVSLSSSAKGDSMIKGSANSVFFNPFKAREEEKRKILEQHVAVTVKQEDMRTIGGKKICWNFRKGRCRFGHNCSFAHDSDIGLKTKEPDADKVISGASVGDVNSGGGGGARTVPEMHVPVAAKPLAPAPPAAAPQDYDKSAVIEGADFQGIKKKKRPGLSQGIVPSKKAMKFHNKVKGDAN